jgi:hypothetical protein
VFNFLSHRKARLSLTVLAVAAVTLVANVPAHAALALTPAGIADGFTLSTYASGGSPSAYTFLAAAPISSSSLVVLDESGFPNSILKLYSDVNGQTPSSFSSSVPFSGGINIANAGGKTYAAAQNGGFSTVSSSLGLAPVLVPNYVHSLGLAGNPVTGHLLAAGSLSGVSGVYDINPLTGASTLIHAGGYDGVSVSPDGSVVYAEIGGGVAGYLIGGAHTQVFSFTPPGGTGPDGTGVIFGGPFNGFVIVNNNDGSVSLVDPTGTMATVIASGGSRGDFTSPDTNDGSLLLSEFGTMFRLNAPGGTFGGPGAVIPEPTSFALFGFMAVGGLVYRWRRRKPAGA